VFLRGCGQCAFDGGCLCSSEVIAKCGSWSRIIDWIGGNWVRSDQLMYRFCLCSEAQEYTWQVGQVADNSVGIPSMACLLSFPYVVICG
jgi:hypothetical protein